MFCFIFERFWTIVFTRDTFFRTPIPRYFEKCQKEWKPNIVWHENYPALKRKAGLSISVCNLPTFRALIVTNLWKRTSIIFARKANIEQSRNSIIIVGHSKCKSTICYPMVIWSKLFYYLCHFNRMQMEKTIVKRKIPKTPLLLNYHYPSLWKLNFNICIPRIWINEDNHTFEYFALKLWGTSCWTSHLKCRMSCLKSTPCTSPPTLLPHPKNTNAYDHM